MINIKETFIDSILSGKQTKFIVLPRKTRFKETDKICFCTGQGTKKFHKLGKVICKKTIDAFFYAPFQYTHEYFKSRGIMLIDEPRRCGQEATYLVDKDGDILAQNCGFKSFWDMYNYCTFNTYSLPLRCQIIEWSEILVY